MKNILRVLQERNGTPAVVALKTLFAVLAKYCGSINALTFYRTKAAMNDNSMRLPLLSQYVDYVVENFKGKNDVHQGLCTNFLMLLMMKKVTTT